MHVYIYLVIITYKKLIFSLKYWVSNGDFFELNMGAKGQVKKLPRHAKSLESRCPPFIFRIRLH